VRVLIAAGGTGGHVLPALALADVLVREHGARVRFVGSEGGPEASMVPAAGYRFDGVPVLPLHRELSWRAARAPFVAARSTRRCARFVRGADVAVGLGGYVSVPPLLAARREHVRSVLLAPDAVPGLATRLLARSADVIAIMFESVRARLGGRARVELIGYPVRASIVAVDGQREALRAEAAEHLDLDPDRHTILVMGGSQGARRLNEIVAAAIPRLATRADLQLLALTGPRQEEAVRPSTPDEVGARVRSVPFLDRMELAYAIADVVVARAGVATCAELAVCGLPSILVPYPYASERHQEANARELERVGAAEVVREADLSPDAFVDRVLGVVDDPARRDRMRESARAWARPDAAERLAVLVAEVGGG